MEDSERAIISPAAGRGAPSLAADVIMAMTHWDLSMLVKMTGAQKMPGGIGGLYSIYRAAREDNGCSFMIAGPFLGAPQAVIGMEQMIAGGAIRFWTLGWCGSLQNDIRIGALLIPDGAVSEEGTSTHYISDGIIPGPDREMADRIFAGASLRGMEIYRGSVWTTDALYRETASKVKSYQRKGILAVEMEMSALLSVAAYRGVSLAGLLVVSDELGSLKWRHGFGSEHLRNATREACLVMIESASGGAFSPVLQ
jgi:uridine phosphorylase